MEDRQHTQAQRHTRWLLCRLLNLAFATFGTSIFCNNPKGVLVGLAVGMIVSVPRIGVTAPVLSVKVAGILASWFASPQIGKITQARLAANISTSTKRANRRL